MKAMLIRAGIDHSYGHWNAPVDPATHEFLYIPIPEAPDETFNPGLDRRFSEFLPALQKFAGKHDCDIYRDLRFPSELLDRAMHLDPDFEELTYGDVGDRRGKQISELKSDDLLVFYAGLKPIRECEHNLLYALIGIFVVDEVASILDVPKERWHENAHTRRAYQRRSDIIVRAKVKGSGRFDRCIPIGEWRDRAYRVRRDVLEKWGGLSVRDGYIQRSGAPPSFLNPNQFYQWYLKWNIPLYGENN